jgi:hypothetical protein
MEKSDFFGRNTLVEVVEMIDNFYFDSDQRFFFLHQKVDFSSSDGEILFEEGVALALIVLFGDFFSLFALFSEVHCMLCS